jgi:Cu/Ag efflux protein CusF
MKSLNIFGAAAALSLALAACGGASPPASDHQDAAGAASATGEVKSPLSGEGTVTAITETEVAIAHGPIQALGWPAMTMRFRIEPAQPPEGIRVGDPVAFQFRERNGGYSLTSISRR